MQTTILPITCPRNEIWKY